MESHRVNSIISGRSPPLVILYTYINHHAGTPKQKKQTIIVIIHFFGLRVPDYGTVIFYRDIKLKIGFGVVISKKVYRWS